MIILFNACAWQHSLSLHVSILGLFEFNLNNTKLNKMYVII